MPFLALKQVVIGIFLVSDSLNGLVDFDFLGVVEIAVKVEGSLFIERFHYRRILSYPETSLVAYASFASQAHEVFAERSIISDRNGGSDGLVLISHFLEFRDGDSLLI